MEERNGKEGGLSHRACVVQCWKFCPAVEHAALGGDTPAAVAGMSDMGLKLMLLIRKVAGLDS